MSRNCVIKNCHDLKPLVVRVYVFGPVTERSLDAKYRPSDVFPYGDLQPHLDLFQFKSDS